MSNNNGGYIYVLSNPSFPEYVKIGYADNVDVRVNQLNRSECTPYAFRIRATLHVKNRLADKQIHKIIDTFKPELRAKEEIKGKMRVREFFAMSVNEAVDLLNTIGSIYGETPTIYEQTDKEKKEECEANETAIAAERHSPFSFYKCGICNGEQILYTEDNSVVCYVVDDRKICYNGEITSLSALAAKLQNKKHSIQGTLYFTYKGEVLSALRKRLEDEGKYNASQSDCVQVFGNDMSQEGVLLYPTSDKYKAICLYDKEKYLLLKGSAIALSVSSSCPTNIKEFRNKYKNSISEDGILKEDICFKSSSAVAKVVTGYSVNGKTFWKNKYGVLLKELLSD